MMIRVLHTAKNMPGLHFVVRPGRSAAAEDGFFANFGAGPAASEIPQALVSARLKPGPRVTGASDIRFSKGPFHAGNP